MMTTSNSNNESSSNTPFHQRYHEMQGHVYAEIGLRNILLIEKMVSNLLDKYQDGEFEAITGALCSLKTVTKLSITSFSKGGQNIMTEGPAVAKRQINFVFDKMRSRREGWDVERYANEGYVHLSKESLLGIKNIVEYEEEIDGSLAYYNGKYIFLSSNSCCFPH